jgi:hypothetical protein
MILPPENLPPVEIDDARLHETTESKSIYDVWDRARGTKFAPAFGRDFKIDELDVSIIPCLSIVDVIDGGQDYFYRFWGTRNVEVKGLEMTGKYMSEGPLPQVIKYGHEQFSALIQRREPTAFVYVGPYKSPIQRQQTTFRSPLSSDGETVDGILSYQDLNHQTLDWSTRFKDFWDEQGVTPPYDPTRHDNC